PASIPNLHSDESRLRIADFGLAIWRDCGLTIEIDECRLRAVAQIANRQSQSTIVNRQNPTSSIHNLHSDGIRLRIADVGFSIWRDGGLTIEIDECRLSAVAQIATRQSQSTIVNRQNPPSSIHNLNSDESQLRISAFGVG